VEKRYVLAETTGVIGKIVVAFPLRKTTKEHSLNNRKAEFSEQHGQVVASYTLVAAGYDKQRYVRVRASRLVELVGLHNGEQVLDVATGTGWAALAAARTVGAAGQVVGVDLTPAMLEQARRKAEMARLTNIDFREGDAQQLDFTPDSFDAVLCASALSFLPDMLAALREWQRVTKQGGRVAFSTSGDTLFQPMGTMFNAHLERYGVLLPRQQRNQGFMDPEQCRDLLREAGCEHIEVHTEQLGYYLSDVDEYWEDTVAWNGSRRGRISQIPPEKIEQFKAEHLAEVRALATDRGIWVDVPCNFALGRKP
jgi:ubiquinone/menaquinone biosynthesis C-methylase UbiE